MKFLGEGPYHKVGFKGLGWLALKPGLWWGRKGIAFPPAGAGVRQNKNQRVLRICPLDCRLTENAR